MNKSDIKLIVLVIFSISAIWLAKFLLTSDDVKEAIVYYDNKVIKRIDLTNNQTQMHNVKGYNGDVIIESKKGRIRVREEKSPLHLCSKQGWVSSSLETIVCLPNKIIIKIEANEEGIDAVVR